MSLYTPSQQALLQLVEEGLQAAMPATDTLQKTVAEAMGYACEAGGKRLRPVLMLAFCETVGGQAKAALPMACAMEMIHSYSLVHDDLPCMDNSLLRRGRPSTFAKYGEDMALLAGDGLLTRAFEWGLSPQATAEVPPATALKAMHLLAQAAGIDGMVGGQTIDIESEGKPISLETLQELQAGKTGALLRASCEMGALLGGGTAVQCDAARRYGEALGRAFQIVDDILDVVSSAEVLGKPVGADGDNEKVTYVSLLGMDKAEELATAYTNEALAALDELDNTADLKMLTKALLTRIS